MSLHGKLVAVMSRWLLNFFFLNSNDGLDAVLSTDLGEKQCSCDVVTWKAGRHRVALASKFFLSKFKQWPGCGPQH